MFSNFIKSLEIDLEQATHAIREMKPLVEATLRKFECAKAVEKRAIQNAHIAQEEYRDVSTANAHLRQKQAELLNERFSQDEDINDWLDRHQ